MKKLLICASIIAAALFCASCDDGYKPSEPNDPDARKVTFTVNATLPSVTGEGMKTAFLNTDYLRIRFADASGAMVGRTQILRKSSGEGTTASFSAEGIAVPNNAATVYAFVDNTSSAVTLGMFPSYDNLASQKGTLADAVAHQVISGSAALAGDKADVALAYKTGIAKVEVTYPEDVTPVSGSTTITLSFNQYNNVVFDLAPTSASTKGDITATATVSGKTAYAYIAVWGSLSEGMISSNIGTTKYGVDVSSTNIKEGKSVKVSTALKTLVYNYKISDDAYTVSDVRGNLKSADEWITLSGGKITVAENKTGNIRTGQIVLDNGKTYIFTQFGPNEFTGSWVLYSKLFDGNKRMGGSKGNSTTVVTIALAEGENGNNITIANMYPGAAVEGKLVIDYDAMSAKLGVYCSHKTYKSDFGYCALLPECASAAAGAYWTGYNFIPKADKQFSDTNYDWLWFTISDDYKQAKYQYYGAGQLTPNGAYRYCGLSFVLASETAITGTAYDLIHQANYNASNAESMYFKR